MLLPNLKIKNRKSAVLSLFLVTLLLSPLLSLVTIPSVSAAPTTVLTAKWTRTGLGTNWEGGVVLGDVTGDGVEDVVYGGNDNLVVLNGNTGATIASYAQTRIGQYCQPQCYDVDGDGVLDILVPLYYLPGLAAVRYDGDSTLQQLWITNTEGSTGSGSVMAKPVAGDIDGDGKLDIFIASQDVSPGGFYDAQGRWNAPNGYDGTVCRIDSANGNILAQTFTWRPCSGGLSLADTDNDGVFELYQGDRGIYYGDGNYGGGERSWWAENLTIRWNRLDALTSSQAPAIADVNNDGILDIITGMYAEMSVLNSTNGQWINHLTTTGGELPDGKGVMSVHYGITVYDIDADGHLELLCSDGDHDDNNATDIYDLVTGQLKAQLPLGNYNNTQPYDNKWSPLVADIYPNGNNPDGSPRMEIITGANTSRTTTYTTYPACLLIYDNQYNLLQNITGLTNQVGYPIVQDIDNDGLLELIAIQNNGVVRAYDTSAPAPGHNEGALPGSHRIRSEVTYYGEKRTGAAVYQPIPWAPDYWTTPLVAAITPTDNSLQVPLTTSSLSFKLRDHQSLPLTYTVTTSPNIGSASGAISSDTYNWNTITLPISSLSYDTTYTYTVSASDGTHTTQRTYSFRTELAPDSSNSLPTQTAPSIVSHDGSDTTSSTFVASNQNTVDTNGDEVANTYVWSINGKSAANLILPFNTRNQTTAKDYSTYSNNGVVTGATWVPVGKVGGAYSFDGKDDAIIISDGGAGYYDNKTYSTYNPELGGDGTWTEMSAEAWINLSAYNNGSRIVAKYPSYELGFQSNFNGGATTALVASVWPHTGVVGTDDNHAALDTAQTVIANVNLELNTWYHIAFTYQSGVGINLYLNGELISQKSGVSGVLECSLGAPVYIGRLVQPFAGLIDEVQIYPYALSSENINNYYQSTKDGLSTSSVYNPADIAVPGNSLTCTVIPSDSYGDGISLSASKTLNPSLPVASNVQISPIRVSNARLDNENLVATYNYFDTDGFAESGSQIWWYINGEHQSEFDGQTTIPASTTLIGQTWYFTVTPCTSTGVVGLTQTAQPTIIIRGNTAPTTGTPTLDSTDGAPAYDDDDITCNSGLTVDSDGDATTNIFHWTKNGISQTNLHMPFDTEIPIVPGANGAISDYSGYDNDAIVNGARWIQDGAVGGALDFDGSDRVQVLDDNHKLGSDGSWSEISIEFWVKSKEDIQTYYFPWVLLAMHNTNFSPLSYPGVFTPTGLAYNVEYSSTGGYDRLQWIVYTGSGEVTTAANIANARSWHHIACTYESGVGLMIYVDGVLSSSTYGAGNLVAVPDGILDIGDTGTVEFGPYGSTKDFVGSLDELRIYPTALSGAQVYQRYMDTKDGLSNSETIVSQETTTGDNWLCQVIPNDSLENGAVANSPAISIGPSSTSFTLTIEPTSNGNTNPAAGAYQYSSGSNVLVQANPNAGYRFDHWSLNGASIYNNPCEFTMNADYTLTAVFVPQTYTLTDSVVGSGSMSKSPDQASYADGTLVELTATAADGYIFSGWSGDLSGTANPAIITMDSNKVVTATFTPQYDFSDGFESSGFSLWNSQTRTTGETTSVLSAIVHQGTYSAMFATNGNGGYERAYTSRSGLSYPELYARAYVYVDQSGIVENGDRFYFMQIMAGSNNLAYGGWRQDASGNLRWHLMARDGTNTVGVYSTSVPAIDNWYCVELHWKADASVGLAELYVNGQVVASITGRNTANYGGATVARIGLPEVYNCAATTAYVDDVALDNAYIGPMGPVEYASLTIVSAVGGVTNPSAGTYQYVEGSPANIQATASAGYAFSGWLLDGNSVGNANPYSLTMDADHTLTPVFAAVPSYQLTVSTTGTGTTNPTDVNLYDQGANVQVMATAGANWHLEYWLLDGVNVGAASTYTVQMNANHELVAVFAENPQSNIVQSDDFESGTLAAWTSSVTSGEVAGISTNPVYGGNYAGRFTSNGGGGYERAYLAETLNPTLSIVNVEGTFSLTQSGIVENGDKMKLIELRAGTTIIAAAGVIQRSGALVWWLESRDGASWVETYSTTATGDLSSWFTLELQWAGDAANGGATLLVNDVQMLQVSGDNTNNYGACTQLRIGLAETYNCGSTTLVLDNVSVSY